MRYSWSDISDVLSECPQKYGRIIEEDGIYYEFSEDRIREAKFELLTPEQQENLSKWCGDKEDWYMQNAPDVWERIEQEAGAEEDKAWRLIEEARQMLDFVEDEDEFYRKEYYWDKI